MTQAQAHPGNPVNQAFSDSTHGDKDPTQTPQAPGKSILMRAQGQAALLSMLQAPSMAQGLGDIPRLPLPPSLGPSAGSASNKSTPFPTSLLTPLPMPKSRTGELHLSEAEQLQAVTNAKLSSSGKRNL